MSYIEIIAAVFGFLCVWFFIVRNPWSWPTGLVQVVLLIAVFREAKLYADMLLHIVYAVLQLYGWWEWARQPGPVPEAGGQTGESPAGTGRIAVRKLGPRGQLVGLSAVLVMTGIFTWLLKSFTDASMPLPDSFVAAASLVAQFLLAWRYVDSWRYWIVVDVVGIGLFASKQLYPTTVLYALFLVMAILGLRAWQAAHRRQTATRADAA